MTSLASSPAHTLWTSLQDTLRNSPFVVLSIVAATTWLVWQLVTPPAAAYRPGSKQKHVVSRPLAGLGAIGVYNNRYQFLYSLFGRPASSISQANDGVAGARMNVRDHILIASANVKDARTFFHGREMQFNDAYMVMFAGVPTLPGWIKWLFRKVGGERQEEEAFDESSFDIKHLRNATSTKRLEALVPEMAAYSMQSFAKLGHTGVIDTHDTIYQLIFRISVRTIGCREHSNDEQKLKKVVDPFWRFMKAAGFFNTHFPLLPLPSTIEKWTGAVKLHAELSSTIDARRRENRAEGDYIQELIDQGVETKTICNFIIGILFAAIINSTGMSAYMLMWAGTKPEVARKLRGEIDDALRRDAKDRGDDYDKVTILEKVSRVQLSTWETQLPYLDACLHETMRILMNSLLFRKYVAKGAGSTVEYGGDAVRHGDFMAFWLAGVHMDPKIYPEPQRWDPDRSFVHKQGTGDGEFLGWGTGRHPCVGMRFAKLEIKVMCACFFLSFDYRSVCLQGVPYTADDLPTPHPDDETARVPLKPVRLAFTQNRSCTEA